MSASFNIDKNIGENFIMDKRNTSVKKGIHLRVTDVLKKSDIKLRLIAKYYILLRNFVLRFLCDER